jgi:putative intracellular protease/amidase
MTTDTQTVAVVLFDGFETLDVFGPVEVLGQLSERYRLLFCSQKGGMVQNNHGIEINTEPFESCTDIDIVLIPGGAGTRSLVSDTAFIDTLGSFAKKARFILTVCTGSGLLARTGLLDGRHATSNKRAFEWAVAQGASVLWQPQARWVVDGTIYTASGVSAGIDMTLGFIADNLGEEQAQEVARNIEYLWNSNCDDDPFGKEPFDDGEPARSTAADKALGA